MTTRQLNKLAAFSALVVICRKAQTTWNGLKAFSEIFTKFSTRVDTLGELKRQQAEATEGLAEQKQQCREEVCGEAATIAGAVRVWAEETSNRVVAAKVNYSYSTLLEGRDTESADKCQIVHDVAEANLASLPKYGVIADDLEALQDTIDAYRDCLTKPRNAITGGKTVTTRVTTEFRAADRLLNKGLDDLVLKFRKSAPTFYQDYKNARAIVDTAATRNTTPAVTPLNAAPDKKAA